METTQISRGPRGGAIAALPPATPLPAAVVAMPKGCPHSAAGRCGARSYQPLHTCGLWRRLAMLAPLWSSAAARKSDGKRGVGASGAGG